MNIMNYTEKDEANLCQDIANEGCKKYDELVGHLNVLLTPYEGHDLPHKLCAFLEVARQKYRMRSDIYNRNGVSMTTDYDYGQYQNTSISICINGNWITEMVKWQRFQYHQDCCWSLPERPRACRTADTTMSSVTYALRCYSTIVNFITRFNGCEDEIKATEDVERAERIIKYSIQLKLLESL